MLRRILFGPMAPKTTPLGPLKLTDAPQSIVLGSWPDGLFGQVAAKGCYLGQLDELRVFSQSIDTNRKFLVYSLTDRQTDKKNIIYNLKRLSI